MQMASHEHRLAKWLWWNPKPKISARSKMKKRKKQLSRKTMVGKELREEDVQNLREMVEEAVETPPHKSKKKKMKRKDEVRPSKVVAEERTSSLVALNNGEIKASVGSPIKTPMVPKKNKG
jgi:hypothetical protein